MDDLKNRGFRVVGNYSRIDLIRCIIGMYDGRNRGVHLCGVGGLRSLGLNGCFLVLQLMLLGCWSVYLGLGPGGESVVGRWGDLGG